MDNRAHEARISSDFDVAGLKIFISKNHYSRYPEYVCKENENWFVAIAVPVLNDYHRLNPYSFTLRDYIGERLQKMGYVITDNFENTITPQQHHQDRVIAFKDTKRNGSPVNETELKLLLGDAAEKFRLVNFPTPLEGMQALRGEKPHRGPRR